MYKETEVQRWEVMFLGSHSWVRTQRPMLSLLFLLLPSHLLGPGDYLLLSIRSAVMGHRLEIVATCILH